jgi:threonyl-tRNA synthetase
MPERKTAREILAAAAGSGAAAPAKDGKGKDSEIIAVRVRGRIVDLHTPVEATAGELAPIRATDGDGLAVIRHSTAHVMADAVQRLFPGTKVTIGPAIEEGFY